MEACRFIRPYGKRMVDFNDGSTITTAPREIIKIMILERRKYVIDAIEDYQKKRAHGIDAPLGLIKARLLALHLELAAGLSRRCESKKDLKRKYWADRVEITANTDYENLIDIFQKLEGYLDDIRLIRIDSIKTYDSTNVEAENLEKGV